MQAHAGAGLDVCKCIAPDVLDVEVPKTAVMIFEDHVDILWITLPNLSLISLLSLFYVLYFGGTSLFQSYVVPDRFNLALVANYV